MAPGLVGEERDGEALQLQGWSSAWHRRSGSQRAPAAGGSKGKSRAAGGGGASWDLCVWAGRKGQEGFGQCEVVWEPPLHQGHRTGSQGAGSVHREGTGSCCGVV